MTGISARSSLRINGNRLHLTLDLPLTMYGDLTAEADRRGKGIRELLVEALMSISRPPELIRTRAESAVRRGWDDFSVAEQLEATTKQVAAWRNGIGVEPHRPGQGKGKI
ncbi:hypothetical protein C5E10_06255 [Pseudoclavibacter sp. RFBG4]|uniref:hypothetical protein n=1 Tax=Pseudoclavibacter sp. RFBG4 TaxID=2080575 RepID=UPI000CE8529B|nr:hypothetical protein [Pseudoclavibacter sp. RFBG4]PPG35190.1 hypothetical protein C5E10_06255 [Pseudoclavibacter sp. RFBG4]